MKTDDIVINGTKLNIFLINRADGVCASLSPDLENEYENIGWGKTEEEAKQKLKKILERN